MWSTSLVPRPRGLGTRLVEYYILKQAGQAPCGIKCWNQSTGGLVKFFRLEINVESKHGDKTSFLGGSWLICGSTCKDLECKNTKDAVP